VEKVGKTIITRIPKHKL